MMKITHVYPQAGVPGQTPIGNGDTEAGVWDDIRFITLRDYDNKVVVIETHQFAFDDVREELDKDAYDPSKLLEFSYADVEKNIHTPKGVKKLKERRFANLSDAWQVDGGVGATKDANAVVVYEPYEEAGHLDCLPELQRLCPRLHVVIFHQVSEKVGVVVEGDIDPDNWEEEFPVMGQCDIPKVEVIVDDLLIKGGIHVWAGMFESYKTIAAIELSAAILQQRKVFELFEVRKQHPILYLCPDMAPELFQEYTRPFGLMNDKEFRWMKPGGDTFHMIDSPVMERAVKGRVLILDTMLDYAQIQKAFESGEWIAFFAKLRRLINVCGCAAIVMLVHPTKTGAKSNSIDPSEYLKDSVTFGGKIDVGFGFSKLEKTSQVMVERIKGRGFKKQQFSFSIAYLDDEGNSNLDRGRFPVYLKPGEAGKKEDHVAKDKGGRRPNPERDAIAQQIKQLKGDGETFPQIAEQLKLSLSTVKRYCITFDSNKENQQ
jgi:hypothetical protein